MISHGKLFDVPQFDNIECDIDKKWWKRRLKRRDPNKLGTRNSGVSSLALLDSGVFLFGFLAHLLFVDADAEMIF